MSFTHLLFLLLFSYTLLFYALQLTLSQKRSVWRLTQLVVDVLVEDDHGAALGYAVDEAIVDALQLSLEGNSLIDQLLMQILVMFANGSRAAVGRLSSGRHGC